MHTSFNHLDVEHCLQINVQDLPVLPICCGMKMYEIKKTLVYVYLFAYFVQRLSDPKYLPDGNSPYAFRRDVNMSTHLPGTTCSEKFFPLKQKSL